MKSLLAVFVCALGLLQASLAHAQQVQAGRGIVLRPTEDSFNYQEYYQVFPNVNKLIYFEDRNLKRQIARASEAKDLKLLDELLTQYVRQFGIQNFRSDRDLALVWQLAQLKDMLRDTSKAVYLYGLAIKNNSRAYDPIRLHFDSLRNTRRNEFVDLEYYYNILARKRRIDTLVPPKGTVLNMGKKINSPAPDYAPYMHPSNKLLLFTSRRGTWDDAIGPDYLQSEDLYYTQENMFNGSWEYAERFPDEINSRYNEGSACLNQEGTRLFFTRCNAPDGLGICDLYEADYKGGKWVNVRNLGANVNSKSWDSHPSITQDGNTLFFTSNRDGGFGRHDLYMSQRQADGTWGPARNLGPTINTIEDEVTPFMHPVNSTLYFSSTGHLNNFGGFDIFKSRWKQTHWEEPRNLGPLVNSTGDEIYFTIDGKGEKLFYAAARRDDPRNLDLYSFPLPMNARPDATVRLKGYLIDSITGQPLTGIVAAVDLDKGTEIAPLYINRAGFFEFQLVANRNYRLVIVGDQYVTIRDEMRISADTLIDYFSRSISLDRPLVYDRMRFQENSAEIDSNVYPRLRRVGYFMKTHPYCKLAIRGHTDSEGDDEYNLVLSRRRAENIRAYLLRYTGLPEAQIEAEGYGETRPIYPNDSKEGRLRNRRVEFEVSVPPEYRARLKEETIVFDDRKGHPLLEPPEMIAPEGGLAGRRTAGPTREEGTLDEEEIDEDKAREDDAAIDDLSDEDFDDLAGAISEMMEENDVGDAAPKPDDKPEDKPAEKPAEDFDVDDDELDDER